MAHFDIFIAIGQSNCEGRGNKALSPLVPTGRVKRYADGYGLDDCNDPAHTGHTQTMDGDTANGGSMWPSFGSAYYAASGREPLIVMCGVGGSSVTKDADQGQGHWESSGTLFNDALAIIGDAILAVTGGGNTYSMRGIISVCGESDALGINASSITKAQYIAAQQHLIDRFRTNLSAAHGAEYAQLPFYMVQVGRLASANPRGYQQVREAQYEICRDYPHTRMVCNIGSRADSYGYYESGSHYSQAGYNYIGEVTAQSILMGANLLNVLAADNVDVQVSEIIIPVYDGFSRYVLNIDKFQPVNPGGDLELTVSLDGGSTFKAASYTTRYWGITQDGIATQDGSGTFNDRPAMKLTKNMLVGGAYAQPNIMRIEFPNRPTIDGWITPFMWEGAFWDSGAKMIRSIGEGCLGTSEAGGNRITHIRLKYHNGNIKRCRYVMEGIR